MSLLTHPYVIQNLNVVIFQCNRKGQFWKIFFKRVTCRINADLLNI